MKHQIIIAFILVCSIATFAQTGTLSGIIKSNDGQPAAWVNIVLAGARKGVVADQQGNYRIKNINPGNYTIVVSFAGLQTQEKEIAIRAGENTFADFTLTEDSKMLEEVIVAGSVNRYIERQPSGSLRLQTPILNVPQNIQVVTGAALKDQQIISMSDGLIRNVSGLTRLEHWGDMYTNITARGSQIQAFRNGFNVVNSFWGPLTEDMSFVDHIEFVKGPAGFMLSNGDPSGLYNVVTKKPGGKTKGEVNITAGSFNLYRATLDLDGKLSRDGHLLYRLNLAAQNKGSFRANEYNDRYALAPVVSYQVDDKTKLTFEWEYQRANMSDVGSYYVFSNKGYATLPRDFTMNPSGMPNTYINDHSFYLTLEHQLNKTWKLTTQASKFLYYMNGTSSWPTSVEPGEIIRTAGSWEARSNMQMGQVFLNGDVITGSIRNKILTGLDISNKKYLADWSQSHDLDTAGATFDPQNPGLGYPPNGYPHFDYSTPLEERAQLSGGIMDQSYTSLYFQDELGFFKDKLRLTLAGRYTQLTQSEWGADAMHAKHFTPRLGISFSLNKSFSAYALYDQAFMPQAGILSNGGKVQPITGNNIEVGLKKDWFGGKWISTLSVYRIIKNNELTADPNSPPNLGLSIELGQKKAEGVELDVRGSIARGFNLTANYAYTMSKVTKVSRGVTDVKVGDIVPFFSKHTANAWLNYRAQGGALKGFGISGGFTFLGDRATYWAPAPDPDKELADYFKLDAGLSWEGESITITANVFNVLDRYLYSGGYETYFPTPAYSWQADPPRNLRLSIGYRF